MDSFIGSLCAILVILVVADLGYLGLNYEFHKQVIKQIQCGQPLHLRVLPAVLSYVTGAFGLACIAWRGSPIPVHQKVPAAAVLGFVGYGLYDTTNYATLIMYPLRMFLQDWTWGTVLYASTMWLFLKLKGILTSAV